MSPWPTEPLALALSPPLPAGPGGAAARVEAALTAWRDALDQAAPPPRRQVLCVLRDDLVRYRVLPWNDGFTSDAGRMALARQGFIDAFGEVARPWQVQIDAPSWGRASLACAIDARLLAGLGTELAARGLRQAGVQPALVRACNLERHSLPKQGGWFVLRHDGGLSLLLWQGDQARHVTQVAGNGTALEVLIQRESFKLGLEDSTTAIHELRSPCAPAATAAATAAETPMASAGAPPAARLRAATPALATAQFRGG